MIPLILLAAAAIVFLLFLSSQVWRRYSPKGEASHAGQLIPVDLEAFENLTDPEEEQFLRVNLSPAEFRGLQRARIRAARMYVAALSGNAGVLVAVGQSARSHADPEIAASGQEILQRAIRLKVWCLLSVLRLNSAMVFPTVLSPSGRIADQYLVVTSMAANLPRKVAA
jgi:hypothetical protein